MLELTMPKRWRTRRAASPRSPPTTLRPGALALLALCVQLFPLTDFRDVILTPTVLLVADVLSQPSVPSSERGTRWTLFLCALALHLRLTLSIRHIKREHSQLATCFPTVNPPCNPLTQNQRASSGPVPVPRNLALELPDPLTPNQRWPVPVPSKNLALELPGRAHSIPISSGRLPVGPHTITSDPAGRARQRARRARALPSIPAQRSISAP